MCNFQKLSQYFFFVLCMLTATLSARGAANDYDSLSNLTVSQLMQEGRSCFERRQPAKALACFLTVSQRLRRSDDDADTELRIRALNNGACVYKYFYFDYSQAYELFIEAYDLCNATGHDELLPLVMVNLGDLLNDYSVSYYSESLSEQARQIFGECMERAREAQNWELMTTAFFNLAHQNFTLPLEEYGFILSDSIPANTPDLQYVRLQYQGIQHVQQQRYAEARDCFLRQLPVVSARWEPERDTLSTYMSIAYTYRMEKDYRHETEYLLMALQLAELSNVGDQAVGLCKLLSDSYLQQGNAERRQYYYLLYLEKKEEAQANKLASIGELNYIHELKQEQERTEKLAVEHQRQQMWLMAAGLVLLVVTLSVLLLWYKNRQLHARNKSLYAKNRQLLDLERSEQTLRKEYEKLAEESKYSRSKLSSEQKDTLVFRIQEILNTPETICQQDFTLAKLAKLVDSNTSYVSQVINENYGTPFSNVLAACRIREACRRISDETDRYRQVTIEAIATGVGFKSRTSFINAFKREVGLTPSEYLRMARTAE